MEIIFPQDVSEIHIFDSSEWHFIGGAHTTKTEQVASEAS